MSPQSLHKTAGCFTIVLALAISYANLASSLAQSQQNDAAPRLRLARGEDGKVTLAFGPLAGADAYCIRIAGEDGGEEKVEVVENVSVTDYSVHGLKNGRDYRFTVRAVFDGRKGPWSNELSARPLDQPGWDTLAEAFASSNPTRSMNPFTFIHGNESESQLRAILRAIHAGRFEGVLLHPIHYEGYLGPRQWAQWKIVFDEAHRLGLAVWQQDDRTYPSGFAAGRVVAANPEYGRTMLVEAAKQVLTGPQKNFSLDISSLLKGRDFLVAVTAYPQNGEPLDLTGRVARGTLEWDVPDGQWTLFVVKAIWRKKGPYAFTTVYRNPVTGVLDPREPFIDFMNPHATDAFIETVYQSVYDRFAAEFGRTFKGFFTDEAPVELYQYTPDFLQRFEKAKGYSIRKYLPSLWHDLGKLDRKVRYDYRDFIREQNATVFFGRSRQWCRDHGVQLIGHVFEDHQQDMRRLEFLDVPGFDAVVGHWYVPNGDVIWRESKMASSVAHYAGSRNDVAMGEIFAATGWRTGLTEMKRMIDWTTVMGINQIVPCGLDTQSPPVWEVTPDFWLHGKNPQWPFFPEYQAAVDRMTMLMRGGRHVAPAIVLDTTESEWMRAGTDLRWSHPAADDLWQSCRAMSQAHVDFDLIPYYVFSDTERTAFDEGRVRIGKEDYRAVVLPGVEFIPATVVERLRDFYDAGGIVVALDRLPSASCNGQEDERVRAAIEGIWGDSASKRGHSAVKSHDQVGAYLQGLNVPDVRTPSGLQRLLYCHRQMHGKDLYFFDNTGPDPIVADVELHGVRGVPNLWDPVTGRIVQAPAYSLQKDMLQLKLNLGEYESLFVVVDPDSPSLPHVEKTDFDLARRTPEGRIVLETTSGGSKRSVWFDANASRRESLANVAAPPKEMILPGPWEARNEVDDDHRLFSTEVRLPRDWPAGSPARLELKGASQIISVEVNGRPVGQRFCPPYSFEVGRKLHSGINSVKIKRIGRYSFKDDQRATAPAQQAILVPRSEILLDNH